jgi:hypothetical protein
MYPSEVEVDVALQGDTREFLEQALVTLHAPADSIMLSASAVDAKLKQKGYKTWLPKLKNHLYQQSKV